MAQGLRPHHHQCYLYGIRKYYDKQRGCVVKKVTFKCMMCDYMTHEKYECYEPPPKEKNKNKVLKRNKCKFSNHQ